MTTCTIEELHARLESENHLTWIFFRGKNRADTEEKEEGAFKQNGTSAWTGYWRGKPKVSYDRIAYWNDKSQILYIGKKSQQDIEEFDFPKGKRSRIPMDDVEKFELFPKLTGDARLQVVIPKSKKRIQVFTYWPKSKDEFLEQYKTLNRVSPRKRRTLSGDEEEKLNNEVNASGLDETAKNEIRREIWCRTKAHDQFRKKLIVKSGEKCALTGMQVESLLVASHIKPWAACRDKPNEQTDVNNGLLLCTPIDKLFDRGYLTFNYNGTIELHKKGHIRFLKQTSLAAFGINGAELPKIKLPLTAKTKEFLTYHRDKVFNRD